MSRLVVATCLALGLSLGVAISASPAAAQPAPQEQVRAPKPSGFWGAGDRGPGAYRWKLLGIGVLIAAASGLVMWRLVRRASLARELGDAARDPGVRGRPVDRRD